VVAAAARERDLAILSDEIYINILYEGTHTSIATLPGMPERTIILDGLSKSYSMTGWRLGYGIVPPELAESFELYNVNIVSCAANFNQWGALAAITGPQDETTAMVAEFKRRRDFLVDGLNELPGVSCVRPAGAFYAFPNIRETGRSAEELAEALLEEAGVAVLAGTSFGAEGEGYLRLSYATTIERLGLALERMGTFLAG
jgi:aspartate/methionine/tyrosine aminotransferase